MSAAWWPPKVGDRLRMLQRSDHTDDVRSVLLHVVAVFKGKDGRIRIVGAWHGINRHGSDRRSYRSWRYEIFDDDSSTWEIWPDGDECPHESFRAQLRTTPAP